MKLVGYSVSKTGIHILSMYWVNFSRKFFNKYALEPSLKMVMLNPARNFEIYASLSKETKGSVKHKNDGYKRTGATKGEIVSVIDEKGVEHVMQMHEAEKYAKRRNLKLVNSESGAANKVKFKLQKSLYGGEAKAQNKEISIKRVLLREETHPHDIEIKVNHILRFLEKGQEVKCIIEKSEKVKKMDEVLSIFDKSRVKQYFFNKSESKKSVTLIYKPTEGKNLPTEEKKSSAESTESSQ